MLASGARLEEMTLLAILKSLDAGGSNVSSTTCALRISRNTIYRKLSRLK